jgi:hypothetical protein
VQGVHDSARALKKKEPDLGNTGAFVVLFIGQQLHVVYVHTYQRSETAVGASMGKFSFYAGYDFYVGRGELDGCRPRTFEHSKRTGCLFKTEKATDKATLKIPVARDR